MKDQFLTILTDGENYIAPSIGDQSEVDARQRKAKESTDGEYGVVAIPLADVFTGAHFKVCAYRPEGEQTVLSLECDGIPIGGVHRRGETGYIRLLMASNKGQNVKWLYGQEPQALE